MKFRRLLPIVVLGSALSAVGTPVVKRVNAKTIPRHILVEITAHGCETKRLTRNDYVAIWYATVKARVGDVDKAGAYIDLQLRDANPMNSRKSALANPSYSVRRLQAKTRFITFSDKRRLVVICFASQYSFPMERAFPSQRV